MKKSKGKRGSIARTGTIHSRSSKQMQKTKGNTLKTGSEVLMGICRMLSQPAGEDQSLEKMLKLIGKAVEFSRASLFLFNRSKGQMEEVATIGSRVDLIESIRFDTGLGLSAWAAGEKRPILLSNLRRKKSGDGIRSFLIVPCLLSGELFGVMNFGHIRPYAFDPEDVEFLTLASLPVTLSLERMFYHAENARLEIELSQAREENRELSEKISRVEAAIPTHQFLENLNEKIKTPLGCITENAEFMLNSFSPHPADKSALHGQRELAAQFKRGLREIKSEVNQITKVTEKLMRKTVITASQG
jgi:transcriptional regulator with GAF, ATPase, and Fis domain